MEASGGRSQILKTEGIQKGQGHPLLRPEQHDRGSNQSLWSRWKAFVTIIFFVIGGLAFALGHHFMNRYLNGREVASISVSQSWIFRFRTAFAFLVNMAFAVSISASYVQYQWFKFHRQSFRVEEIDSLTDVLQNGLRILYNLVFIHQPVLLLIAIVAWTIPFAAVVTPGSLTVEPVKTTSIVQAHVPQPDYNSTFFGDITDDPANSVAASAMIYKLAYNTAAAGEPVTLPSKFQNESYSLTFFGPAVRCQSANGSLVRNQSLDSDTNQLGGLAYQYISWVPGYKPSCRALGGLSPPSFVITLDEAEDSVASIFVTTNVGTWNNTIPYRVYNYTAHALVLNVTECHLWNATYDVDFSFRYPNQTRQVTVPEWLNPVAPPTDDLDYFQPWSTTASSHLSYLCLMQAFGKLLVGWSSTSQYISTTLSVYTSWQIMDIDWSQGSTVQRGLESLFQNLNLSMLSQKNFTMSESATQPVPVTVTTYPITYTYSQWELLTAYGCALIFALISASIGSYACFVNEGSYQNIFSSFLRATTGSDISGLSASNDDASDPLPAMLAKATVNLGSRNAKHK